MKRSELKNILKPLVKECVKEVILDESILSGIILEVARRMGGVQINETRSTAKPTEKDPIVERMKCNAFDEEQSNKLQEQRNKLMTAVGQSAYNGVNLFEGTTPAPGQASPTQQAHPLSGQAADDSGVDISTLSGVVGRNWNAHMGNVSEGK